MSDDRKETAERISSVAADFPNNSYSERSSKKEKAEKEPKKLEKVVTGEVIQKKKGLGSKVKESFSGDDARSVGSYIFFDVFIPAAKSMVLDAVSQGAERLLYGETRGRTRPSGRGAGYTSYNRMYSKESSRENRRELSGRARSTHDFDEIILAERGEAEEVLDQLMNLIDDYGHAKVSDLYELLGISKNYTDDRWGWEDLRSASTTRVRQGYLLDLPPTIPLK